MANSKRLTVPIETDGSGDAIVYSASMTGFVQRIRYVPDGTKPLAATADFTITADQSGAAILTITDQAQAGTDYAPRMATTDTAGGVALFAAGGKPVLDKIPLAAERIKAVIAQGGDTCKGTLIYYVGD